MIFGDDTIEQAVVASTARPIVAGNNMIYFSLEIIEGQLPAQGGASKLFIAVIGRPLWSFNKGGEVGGEAGKLCLEVLPDYVIVNHFSPGRLRPGETLII